VLLSLLLIRKKVTKVPYLRTNRNGFSAYSKNQETRVFHGRKPGKCSIKTPDDFQGLVIVNDKEYDKKTFDVEIKLDANSIKFVEVYKNEKAAQLISAKVSPRVGFDPYPMILIL
jgi:hypothetical protein